MNSHDVSDHESSWQILLDFGLNLDESCIFARSNLSLSAPNLSVLCTPDRPPPLFLWSLAGEVGRDVLRRTKPVDCVLLGVNGAWWFITSLGYAVPRWTPRILAHAVFEIKKGTRVLTHSPNAIHFYFLLFLV